MDADVLALVEPMGMIQAARDDFAQVILRHRHLACELCGMAKLRPRPAALLLGDLPIAAAFGLQDPKHGLVNGDLPRLRVMRRLRGRQVIVCQRLEQHRMLIWAKALRIERTNV